MTQPNQQFTTTDLTIPSSSLLQLKIIPGPLQITIKDINKGTGLHAITVDIVEKTSYLYNIVQPKDVIVSLDGILLESTSVDVHQFKNLLQRTSQKPERTMVIRRPTMVPLPNTTNATFATNSNVARPQMQQPQMQQPKSISSESNTNKRKAPNNSPEQKQQKEQKSLETTSQQTINGTSESTSMDIASSNNQNSAPNSTTTSSSSSSSSSLITNATKEDTTSSTTKSTHNTPKENKKQDHLNQSVKQPQEEQSRYQKFDPKHICDLCGKRDKYKKMNMQKCKTCGIYVHEECYCLLNQYPGKKYPDWECWACKSVGKSVLVNKNGLKKEIKIIKERPTQCALCAVKTGVHAMHPLYTINGPHGQPLLGKDDSLSWVHTLCALFISGNESSRGSVYGCDEDGVYVCDSGDEKESDDDDNDDDKKSDDNNSESIPASGNGYNFEYLEKGENVLEAAPHHFIITGKSDPNVEAETLRYMTECRNTVRCTICKNPDKHSRRLAVQCCYDDDCTQGVHVGCAKWQTDSKEELIHFFPGTTDGDIELGTEMKFYCKKHAKMASMPQRKNKKISPPKNSQLDSSSTKFIHNIDDEEEVIFDNDSDEDVKGEETSKNTLKKKTMKDGEEGKIINKNSKYHRQLRERKEKETEFVKELKEMMNAATSKSDYLVQKKKRKIWWAEYQSLTKSDFKKVWIKCESRIQPFEQQFFEKFDQKSQQKRKASPSNTVNKQPESTSANMAESNMSDEQERPRVKYSKTWAKLFDPAEYDQDLMDLEDEEIYFEEEITLSDIEKEEDAPISFTR